MSLSNLWNKSEINRILLAFMEIKDEDASFNWIEELVKVLGNTKQFKGLTLDKLYKGLKGVDLENVDDITDAILKLGNEGAWSKIKKGASQLWKSFKPMIPAFAIWGTVVASVAIPALVGYYNTFDKLSEKAEKSRV